MTNDQPLTPKEQKVIEEFEARSGLGALADLITQASLLISEISEHPGYQALLAKGYQPDLNIADAQTALVYLIWEVEPPSIPVPKILEIEVSNE